MVVKNVKLKSFDPFGLEYEQPTKFKKYRKAYNDKEAISYTQYLNFEARDYFKSINVFGGPDPISEQFPHASSMNYAENSPVANIDLHGLQKVHYSAGVLSSPSFIDAEQVQRQTMGGKEFKSALTSQNKIDVMYVRASAGSVDGIVGGPFKNFGEFYKRIGESYFLNSATKDDYMDIFDAFKNLEEGKELLIIAIDCLDECSLEDIIETTASLNHEEYHATRDLLGTSDSATEEHLDFFDRATVTTPSVHEIVTNPKYRDTKAYKELMKIFELIDAELSKPLPATKYDD